MSMPLPAKPQSAISPAVWGMLMLLGLIWGASFFFARIAVKEVPPLMLVLLRVAIAAAALHLYLLAKGDWAKFREQPFAPFILLGLLNNAIPFSLLFIGQTKLGAGLAAILNALVPFWTVVAANFLTADEKFTASKLTGILLGVAGAAIIIGPSAVSGLGAPLWAKLAVIAAGISYAFASIYAKRFKSVPPIVTAAGQLTASSLIMLPAALLAHGLWSPLSVTPPVWLAVLSLALVSTSLAYIIFFRIIAAAGATTVSLVTLLVPVSAVMLGTVFLGESLSLPELAGMALIGLGLVIIDGRTLAALKRHKS
jgi:drug/metabolite transporter (DMT)-like permease